MLRVHFVQQGFALSDPGMEEALHDIPTLRACARLDAGTDLIPDDSSILRFRHRLEQQGLAERVLTEANALRIERGLLLRRGTTVDATPINAPRLTTNQDRQRDPEIHPAKRCIGRLSSKQRLRQYVASPIAGRLPILPAPIPVAECFQACITALSQPSCRQVPAKH